MPERLSNLAIMQESKVSEAAVTNSSLLLSSLKAAVIHTKINIIIHAYIHLHSYIIYAYLGSVNTSSKVRPYTRGLRHIRTNKNV